MSGLPSASSAPARGSSIYDNPRPGTSKQAMMEEEEEEEDGEEGDEVREWKKIILCYFLWQLHFGGQQGIQ